jgi:hypothetical protein
MYYRELFHQYAAFLIIDNMKGFGTRLTLLVNAKNV